MHSTLVYSFRTNKDVDLFRNAGIGVFEFGKLKEDLLIFCEMIKQIHPTRIIGISAVVGESRFETEAVNVFGKHGTVNMGGRDRYQLHVPTEKPFATSKKPTTSFCNWTMYKLSEVVEGSSANVTFLHYTKADLPLVLEYLQSASMHRV